MQLLHVPTITLFVQNLLNSRRAAKGLRRMLHLRICVWASVLLASSVSCLAQDSIVVKGKFPENTRYAKVLMKKFGVGMFPVGGAIIKKR